MKINLVTDFSPQTEENLRLQEEAQKLGHTLTVINAKDFTFTLKDNDLNLDPITLNHPDLVFFRAILTAPRQIAHTIPHLKARGIKVFDNNLLHHQYSIDKVSDIFKLSQASIPFPQTYYSRHFTDYPQKAKLLKYPVILKSTRSGKGKNIYLLNNETELQTFINEAQENDLNARHYLLQEYIPYDVDLRILIIGDHLFAMQRIPKPGEFRANFSLGGSVKLYDLDQEGQDLARRALKAVQMDIAGVDMLITPDNQRYILEVNHSAGFTGMEQATNQNIAKIWLETALAKAD